MILLLGASGYIGRTFAAELRRRGQPFIPLTRETLDYTRFDLLFDYLRTMRPAFVINAAGFYCRREEEGLETAREQAMLANALLPQMIARVCLMTRTPWGHVSSGSIYTGAKILEHGKPRVERDLAGAEAQEVFKHRRHLMLGFTELDEPNFCFRHEPCSFQCGTKALAEEAIREIGQGYLWRPRLAFSDRRSPQDFLWQFQHEARQWDTIDSLSHLGDCVHACLDLWEMKAPFGVYNVTNPGAVRMRDLAAMMQQALDLSRPIEFEERRVEPAAGRWPPQSHCILDVSKLLSTGVKMRSLEAALEESLRVKNGRGNGAKARASG